MIESKNIVNILEWLDKFRRRIVIMFAIPFILTIFAYFISDNILKIISIPLMDKKLYFLTPVEAIMTKLKISFFCGLIMSLPILISIIISMVSEFVPKKALTKLYIFVVPVFSMALVTGITFGYKLHSSPSVANPSIPHETRRVSTSTHVKSTKTFGLSLI